MLPPPTHGNHKPSAIKEKLGTSGTLGLEHFSRFMEPKPSGRFASLLMVILQKKKMSVA